MSNSLSDFPPLTAEDDDLYERSVKKSKYRSTSPEYSDVEMVPETCMHETQPMLSTGYEVGSEEQKDPGMPRISFKEMLGGITATANGNPTGETVYPDSDDDAYNKDEDEPDCPLICMKKEEKVTLRSKWRNSLIIKVWGKL